MSGCEISVLPCQAILSLIVVILNETDYVLISYLRYKVSCIFKQWAIVDNL